MIVVGSRAPDFTLKGIYQGRIAEYSLRSYPGNWRALFFYPVGEPVG